MPQLKPQQAPPPDYYAGNLRVLLTHVSDFYSDLLSVEERQFINSLLGLSSDAQRLYARLLGRKGPWIRLDKLSYQEIDDLPAALAMLAGVGLITLNEAAPADVLLTLLTQAERSKVIPTIPRASRASWISACVSRYHDDWIRNRLARYCGWVALANLHLVRLCQLLFFGDDHQDTSTFVLRDLGLVRFERYPLRRDRRLFPDRAALERFRALRRLGSLSHRLQEMPALADWLTGQLSLPVLTRQEQRQKDRTLNRLGQFYERAGDFDSALNCYAMSRMHPSRERRARILKKLGDLSGARALAAKMGTQPRCAEEVDFANRLGVRRKPSAHEVTTIPLREPPGVGIEAHAAALLGASGGIVFHLENSFPRALAGLAFWAEIFEDLPGAFANPFQSGPMDLFWPDFAQTRSEQLARQARTLAAPNRFSTALRRTYSEKHGIANRLVSWRHFTSEVLEAVLDTIPEPALLALACHVIRWPYRTRTGFPDLVVIYGPGNYEYVEVKGPTDQLQPAQRVWLQALADMGQPARVLKFKSC